MHEKCCSSPPAPQKQSLSRRRLKAVSTTCARPARSRCTLLCLSHPPRAHARQMHPRACIVCDDDATLDLRVRTVRCVAHMQLRASYNMLMHFIVTSKGWRRCTTNCWATGLKRSCLVPPLRFEGAAKEYSIDQCRAQRIRCIKLY